MAYQNPIPSIDDEQQSRRIHVAFTFEKPVTKAEAAESLNRWFEEGNRFTPQHIKLSGDIGTYYKTTQTVLSEVNRDPEGYGPRKIG